MILPGEIVVQQEAWKDACEGAAAAKRWYAAASPYATPEALKEALARTEALRWISVEDRLPPVTQLVMVNTKEMGPLFADRTTSNPQHGWSCMGTITHWMPLPALPSPLATPTLQVTIICSNCGTKMPGGCDGIFKKDGRACLLNRADHSQLPQHGSQK